jgi:hypothetical protein
LLPFWQNLYWVTTLFFCDQFIKVFPDCFAILAEDFSVLAEQPCVPLMFLI